MYRISKEEIESSIKMHEKMLSYGKGKTIPDEIHEGDVVRLEFYDHVFKSDEPILMIAYGYVFYMGEKHLVLDTWHPAMRSKYDRDGCVDQYSILLSTVVKFEKMQ